MAEEQKYLVLKSDALDDIMIANIKAMLNNDASASKAYTKCMEIITKNALSPEDFLGKEDISNDLS